MSLPRLNRQSLHLVLGAGQAKAAETKPEDGSFLGGRIGSLPEPRIYFSPVRSPFAVIPSSDRWKDTFSLLGKSKVLCSDASGSVAMYNTESHSLMSLPELNSPKGRRYIAVSIPHVDSAMFGDKIFGDHTNSLYMMNMVPGEACSFEVLAYYPKSHWCWRPLPAPPFLSDPNYRPPDSITFAFEATYSFDTVDQQWNMAGDWLLPFRSKLEYDNELKMWFGISTRRPYELCAIDLSTVFFLGSCDKLPTVQHVGLDVDPPQNWVLIDVALVNLGSGRFCIAKFFDVIDDQDGYESHVVVFTGVEVVPSHKDEGVLSMVNHKSECLVTNEIERVL
ncbi:hypothetical protein BRADI_1g49603v3 [Brachypodium distachyon]|uniref:F-box associated domain-containing protein n=1 Tax=Brachypodium distachyon TaxID=15368 RepID=A0A2K2DQK9_BRADI|nr:hypothetical protein BRADI_1g49603v3 [Brachypodium distachyon]